MAEPPLDADPAESGGFGVKPPPSVCVRATEKPRNPSRGTSVPFRAKTPAASLWARARGVVCDRSDGGGSTLNTVNDPFRVDTASSQNWGVSGQLLGQCADSWERRLCRPCPKSPLFRELFRQNSNFLDKVALTWHLHWPKSGRISMKISSKHLQNGCHASPAGDLRICHSINWSVRGPEHGGKRRGPRSLPCQRAFRASPKELHQRRSRLRPAGHIWQPWCRHRSLGSPP